MAVPGSATYSVSAKEAAHISFRDLIDAGISNGYVNIRDASDVLLAQIALNDPCGTVDAGTGQLTIGIAGPDTSADATGTAAYAEFCDSDGNVLLSLPAQEGAAPVSGYIVINTLAVISGGQVDIVSATIG